MKAYIVKKYVLVHDWAPHPVELGMEYRNEEEYGEEGIREVKGIRVQERDREIGEWEKGNFFTEMR